ncbi:transporter [Rhodobacterales bacterium 52_120_T64]|nr:transporter [Rhodobacterales bacterium 52_120_T64]
MRKIIALASGLLFSFGLIISDMVNPARVIAFLDVTGDWDPTLGFVMGGAITTASIAWIIARPRKSAYFGGTIPPMPTQPVDRNLVTGSAIFGIGWGLVGICPGPAIVAMSFGKWEVAVFIVAMMAGMALYNFGWFKLPKLGLGPA